MIQLMYLVIGALVTWCLTVYLKHLWKVLRLPPGPFPLPFIGNLHLMNQDRSAARDYTRLSKIYGDVFSVSFGEYRGVLGLRGDGYV